MKMLLLALAVSGSFSVAQAQVLLDAPGRAARAQRANPGLNGELPGTELRRLDSTTIGEQLGNQGRRKSGAAPLTPAENKEAGELFVQAYFDCTRGAAAVKVKDGNAAALAYMDAEEILLSLQDQYPAWRPEVVQSRRQMIAEQMIGPVAELLPEYVQSAALCQRAVADYRERKWDAAIEKLSNALSLDINNARAHLYLSLAASARGWVDLADRELNIARDLNPGIERELDAVPPLKE